MIEVSTETSGGGILEMRLSGQVTRMDYDQVLIPAIDAALAAHDRLRVLVVVDEGFTGYDLSAAWADTKLGLNHWSGFDRVAVAADGGWIATAVRAFAVLMPGPVQVFALAETDDARRWLRESLGAVHVVDLGEPCLQVQLMGRPDPADFEQAEGDLEAKLRSRERFRLLLDLREFDGWQGFSAMAAHFSLAREHAPLVERAAVVGAHAWQHMAQRVAGRFLNADTRFFSDTEFDAARDWLTSA